MDMVDIPSGYVKIAIGNGPVEIVSLPIQHGDFPVRYVKSPEGSSSVKQTSCKHSSMLLDVAGIHH